MTPKKTPAKVIELSRPVAVLNFTCMGKHLSPDKKTILVTLAFNHGGKTPDPNVIDERFTLNMTPANAALLDVGDVYTAPLRLK